MKQNTEQRHQLAAAKQTPLLDGVFRKSTLSGGGNCVEIAKNANNTVQVRDSKDSTGPVLTFTFEEWSAFLQGVRNNEFEIR